MVKTASQPTRQPQRASQPTSQPTTASQPAQPAHRHHQPASPHRPANQPSQLASQPVMLMSLIIFKYKEVSAELKSCFLMQHKPASHPARMPVRGDGTRMRGLHLLSSMRPEACPEFNSYKASQSVHSLRPSYFMARFKIRIGPSWSAGGRPSGCIGMARFAWRSSWSAGGRPCGGLGMARFAWRSWRLS